MPCFHPLTGWRSRSGRDPKTGHWPIVFKARDGLPKEKILVKCGKCMGCRLEYARQWAIRCVKESEMHDDNCFITLTYDDVNLELKTRIIDETDSESKLYTLNKRELTLWFKRLRKVVWNAERKKIRYYACGEYGSETERPHYHVAIFGWSPADKIYWKGKDTNKLYTSKIIEDTWKNGYAVVGSLNWDSASYIAGYIQKKIYGEMAEAWYNGRAAEYTTMSRRPGIATEWYEKYKVDLDEDSCYIRKGIFARPPKFFDNLLERENPKELERRKDIRKKNVVNLTRKQRLYAERIAKARYKSTKRNKL